MANQRKVRGNYEIQLRKAFRKQHNNVSDTMMVRRALEGGRSAGFRFNSHSRGVALTFEKETP